MNRIVRGAMAFAVLTALAAGSAFAQGGQRGFIERKVWYVTEDGKIGSADYWRIFMGNYDIKVNQNVFGKGTVTVDARMNFQLMSSGYIEGNGTGSEGRIVTMPGMRIREGDKVREVKLDEILYIYDYGTKIALKGDLISKADPKVKGSTNEYAAGVKGDFVIGHEEKVNLDVKRFQFTEYRKVKGNFGEEELKEFQDRVPIIGISFTKRGAEALAKEPRTSFD